MPLSVVAWGVGGSGGHGLSQAEAEAGDKADRGPAAKSDLGGAGKCLTPCLAPERASARSLEVPVRGEGYKPWTRIGPGEGALEAKGGAEQAQSADGCNG